MSRAAPRPQGPAWDGVAVFIFALSLRLLFAAIVHDTYDFDEFVLLLLGRDYAHGAVPYSGFMFFHPPGMLVVLRLLEPLTSLWWPSGRIVTCAIDAGTAWLVWLVGRSLYDRRIALLAAVLYAASPLALVSGARIGQDPVITFLLTAGIALVVLRPDWIGATVGGLCLAAAVWVKYPAAAFLPAYLLAARRRAPVVLVSAVAGSALLIAPFLPQHHDLYYQTVTFQRTRWVMRLDTRAGTVLLYGLLANLFAFPGLVRRGPLWLKIAFLTGAIFLFSSQIYYHYFVPIVPFAALLAAPVIAAVPRVGIRVAAIAALAFTIAWGAYIVNGGLNPLYITAARLSSIQPAVRILETRTPPSKPVLGDQMEYQYLAHRPALDDYFWNIGVLVDAQYLERRVSLAGAIVMSYGASSGYPLGFSQWLDRHYERIDTGAAIVWLPRRPSK